MTITAEKASIAESVKINLRANNSREAMLARYLRSQKDSGIEMKTNVLNPTFAFLELYAVGEQPGVDVSKEEIERVLVESMIALSAQMSSHANYARTKFGVNLVADSWRMFGLLPSPIADLYVPTEDRGISDSIQFSEIPSKDRLDRLAQILGLPVEADDLSLAFDDRLVDIAELSVSIDDRLTDSDLDDDDDNLSDDEWLAKTDSIKIGTVEIGDR
jgi:hypothetical protein